MNAILESLSVIEQVGLTIIGESRGESVEGQIAVGCVIRNRLQNGRFKSYAEVIFEPFQFSCWNSKDKNLPFLMDLAKEFVSGNKVSDPTYNQCLFIASGIYGWQLMDNTSGARFYMTESLFDSSDRPNWAKNPRKMKTIGHHIFFSL